MKVNFLDESKNELTLELEGEGHSFSNALHAMVTTNDAVDFAGYNIAHPLVAQPIFYIRMKGRKKPKTALFKGSRDLMKKLDDLQKAFKKAL